MNIGRLALPLAPVLSCVVVACGTSNAPLDDKTPDVAAAPDAGGGAANGTAASTLGADDEVIALDGAQVPKLLGASPSAVVAFRWDGAAWAEIASQIDPREVRPFSDALSAADPRKALATAVTTSFYTDSNAAPGDGTTYVDVDHDPSFDADDELVVLASDLGGRAPDGAAPPDGANAATRTELRASVDGDPARAGYAYLFVRTTRAATREPAVAMTVKFTASSGDFKTFYATNTSDSSGGVSRGCGASAWGVVYPEDTTIRGATYARHFAGRWLSDEMRVVGATEHPDIVDVHETRPAFVGFTGDVATTVATPLPASSHACARSITSFSGGPGTIVTLRTGPIRAIRSYFGANSGTITQRTHLFYPKKEDIYTYLRVHPIAGADDGLDLAPEAKGMTYFNEHNTKGLVVDGEPDTYDRTFARWEMVTGASQGTLLSIHRQVLVDLGPGSATTYAPQTMWLDVTASTCVCSGDASLLGVHGPSVRDPGGPLPNTDPLRGDAGQVFFLRSLHYIDGATTPDQAQRRVADATGLRVSIDGGQAFDPYATTCGDGVCEANETSASCSADCKPVLGASSCGDAKCVEGEQFTCLADCPPTAHAAYFGCLDASCAATYDACGSDPGCTDSLKCLEGCTDGLATCQTTCAAAITDVGSLDLAKALAQCSTSKCAAQF